MLKKLFKPVLKEAQELIEKEHNEKGLTNEILEAQIELNKIRHTLDIPDDTKAIYEEYVQ